MLLNFRWQVCNNRAYLTIEARLSTNVDPNNGNIPSTSPFINPYLRLLVALVCDLIAFCLITLLISIAVEIPYLLSGLSFDTLLQLAVVAQTLHLSGIRDLFFIGSLIPNILLFVWYFGYLRHERTTTFGERLVGIQTASNTDTRPFQYGTVLQFGILLASLILCYFLVFSTPSPLTNWLLVDFLPRAISW